MVFFAILLLDADSSCMYFFFVEWLCYVNYTIELVKVLCIARFDGMRKNLRIPYLTCVFLHTLATDRRVGSGCWPLSVFPHLRFDTLLNFWAKISHFVKSGFTCPWGDLNLN